MTNALARVARLTLLIAVLFATETALPAAAFAQECDPVDPHCWGSNDTQAPQVTIIPASGTFGSATKTITIEWCDNLSLTSQAIVLNGIDVTASFNFVPGTRSGCGVFATSSGTVTLTLGPNTLNASIADNGGNVGASNASYGLLNGFVTIDGGFNNNDHQAAGLCEAGCFAATHAQSTVPYFSAGAPRSVTLVYNGDRAFPMPFVYVDATAFTSDAPSIQEFWLEAKVNGVFRTFRNGETRLRFAGAAEVRRFAGQLDVRDLATGMYPLDIILTTVFSGGSTEPKTLSTKLLVVNENASAIAAGWSIAGIQRLYADAQSNVLIAEGDGSAVYFASCGASCYVSPQGEHSALSYNASTGTYTRRYPDSAKVTFNAQGQMTQVTDRFNNAIGLAYDGSGRLWKIEDPYRTYAGGTLRSFITLVYNANGLSRIEEPGADGSPSTGRSTVVTVDGSRRLTAITDPDNIATSFGYDANGRLSTVTDRRGATSTFVYDAQSWKLAEVVAPQIAIDAGGGATQTATPTTLLRAWQIVGVPTTATASPNSPATPLHPDSTIGRITDAEGRVIRFRVDRWGQPVRLWDPLGRLTSVTRNADGLPTILTSHTGAVDSMSYEGPRLIRVRPAGQHAAYIRYGVASQPDSIWGTGQLARRFFLHNVTGRVDSVKVQGVDSLIRYTYDARHRVIEVKDQQQHRLIYRYDARTGNLDSTHTAPSNHYSITRFDAIGRDSASFAEGQLVGRVIYDVLNRPRELYEGTQPNPAIISYDALFRTQVEDRKGQVYTFQYNALGWLTRDEDPTAAAMTYRHDRTGLVTSRTNRRGQAIDYRYDLLGRLVSKRGVNVAADSFAYSADDRKVVGISTYSRDSLFLNVHGQPDSAATWLNGKRYRRHYRWSGSGVLDSLGISTTSAVVFAQRRYVQPTGVLDTLRVAGQAIRFAYDKEFQRTSTVFPFSGGTVTRSEYYTTLHQRYRTTFSNTSIDLALWRNYIYDERGRIEQEDRKANPFGKARVFAYNDRGHLARVELATITSGIECPPPSGTEIINDGASCASTSNWTVDAVHRFAYDSAGNLREHLDSLPNVITAGAHATGNRIATWGAVTYGHDADGNRTSRTAGGVTTTYVWSADGRLTSVASGGTTLRYDYNAFGQPVRRTRNWAEDRYFLWDGDHLLAELNASSQRVSEYVYEPGIDNPVALVTGATAIAATRYFEEDELGNVVGVFQSGVSQTIRYDARGRIEEITGVLADTNRLRWKGLVWEGDVAQLYYVRNRWYDPETGRFMTEDPIGLLGGPNVYAFGGNDPINAADPFGLHCYYGSERHGEGSTIKYEGTIYVCTSEGRWAQVMVEIETRANAGGGGGGGASSGMGGSAGSGGSGAGARPGPAPPPRRETPNQCVGRVFVENFRATNEGLSTSLGGAGRTVGMFALNGLAAYTTNTTGSLPLVADYAGRHLAVIVSDGLGVSTAMPRFSGVLNGVAARGGSILLINFARSGLIFGALQLGIALGSGGTALGSCY